MQNTERDSEPIRRGEVAFGVMRFVSLGLLSLAVVILPVASRAEENGTKPAANERWPAGRTITSHSAHQKRIYAELEKPATHEFTQASLKEIAKWLEERGDATVILDVPALVADGVDTDETLFSARFVGRALRTELAALLSSRQLRLLVRDEAAWITTEIASETYSEVRLYQVHDLVVDDDDEAALNAQHQELAELVKSQVEPESWGGFCELSEIQAPGVIGLVALHTPSTHEKIERLLNDLRAARSAEVRAVQANAGKRAAAAKNEANRDDRIPRWGMAPPPPRLQRGKVVFSQTQNERTLREKLLQPASFDFQEISLGEIAKQLKAKHGITITFDERSLIADGKDRDTRITFRWRNGSLRHALRALLDWHGLDYVIRDDAVCVLTKTSAEAVEETHVYQVHDLFAFDTALLGEQPDFESLLELTTSCVQPHSWREGSSGLYLQKYQAAGLQVLVLKQMQPVHEDVAALYDLLRDAYEPKVYEAQRRRPVVMPEPPQQPAVRGMGGGF